MTATTVLPEIPAPDALAGDADAVEPGRVVVAVVLYRRGRIGLFRRSTRVRHDQGRWHCITGYVEPGQTPQGQALQELFEETGLREADVLDLRRGSTLDLPDGAGRTWTVHTFRALTEVRVLRLDDEHDRYRWVRLTDLDALHPTVEWLGDVVTAADDR